MDNSASPDAIQVTPRDRDLWIRTLIGEAGDDPSAPAVAHVIANRAKANRQAPGAVVMAPGQFEPWATRSRELMSYAPNSPAYQHAAQIVDGVMSGEIPDPTGGATQFYAPAAQAALGRPPPQWDNGTGVQIGAQRFFRNPMAQAAAQNTPDDAGEALLKAYTKQAPASPAAPANAVPASAPAAQDAADPAGEALLQAYSKPVAKPSIKFLTPEQAKAEASRGALSNAPGGDDLLGGGIKNVSTGIIKGAADIPGMPGNVGSLADYLLDRGESFLTGKPLADVQAKNALAETAARQHQAQDWAKLGPVGSLIGKIPDASTLPTGSQIAAPILARTGAYVPETETGHMLQAGVETAIGALGPGARGADLSPTPMPAPLTANALAAPAVSGAAGQFGTDATGEPLVGMVAAGLPGLALKTGSVLANRAVGTIEPETAALAQMARDHYGIPVNAGQMSESPAVRFAGSTANRLPFSGAEAEIARQHSAFNRAISNTFGEDVDKITPAVMQSAKTRLGQEFDAAAQGTTIQVDVPFVSELHRIMTDASSVLPKSEVGPINRQVQNFLDTIDPATGTISGESYQALTRKGAPLERVQNSADPNVAHYGSQLRDALDDAMQRSAPPALAARLTTARRQYKAMKTIEDLVEKSPTGDMSPALLMGAVRKSYGGMAYSGASDLGNLARIGQRFLKEPKSSGTAERLHTMDLLARIGGLAGGAFGLHEAGLLPEISPETMATSAMAIPSSIIAGRSLSSALRSNWLARAMLNRSQGRPAPVGFSNKLINSAVPFFARSGNAILPPNGP